MSIQEYLIELYEEKLSNYFPKKTDKWKNKYKEQIKNPHDEPWLTLLAIYSIFGDQKSINEKSRLNAINWLISKCGLRNSLLFDEIEEIKLEEKLPEIHSYRDQLKKSVYHLYPDRNDIIKLKQRKINASFEGSTNLDLKITGYQGDIKKVVYIEAKYLSDISYQITYNPVRDQIIRNIDAGINLVYPKDPKKKILEDPGDFYFLLLTPKIFRPFELGEIKESNLDIFDPRNSRLYCYKMRDYLNPENLKRCLPHRLKESNSNGYHLNDDEWISLSNNIGWITFEDIVDAALTYETIDSEFEREQIKTFFEIRNLMNL